MPWNDNTGKWEQPPIVLPSNAAEAKKSFSPWPLMKPKEEKPVFDKKKVVASAD